ncbi:hypothetical protein Tco_0215159 [Tanacetum coccineum]
MPWERKRKLGIRQEVLLLPVASPRGRSGIREVELASTSQSDIKCSYETMAPSTHNGIMDKAMLSSKPSVIVGLYAQSWRRGNLAVKVVSMETKDVAKATEVDEPAAAPTISSERCALFSISIKSKAVVAKVVAFKSAVEQHRHVASRVKTCHLLDAGQELEQTAGLPTHFTCPLSIITTMSATTTNTPRTHIPLRPNLGVLQNVPTQPPIRTDEQIVPRSQWLTIGKSNLLFNAQKIQKNPIFQISVDILSNTNFFQAFTASANVPAIYLQQFWNTMKYNEKTGIYSYQVDEQWFDLSADLLRKALAITPVIPAHPFELPPSGDTVIDLFNDWVMPEPVEIVSNIKGIIADMGRVHSRDPDIFLTQSKSQRQSEEPKEESNSSPHSLWTVFQGDNILLGSPNTNPATPWICLTSTGDDYVLGNLKFVPKGESVEVFGMAIPDPLITEAIQQSSYYPKYLEMCRIDIP